jgi:uncharacterized protein
MKELLITLLLLIISTYLLIALYLYFNQRSMIYLPHRESFTAPAKTIEIESDGHTLKGWVVNPGRPRAILYFGGNAERIHHNIDAFRQTFPDYSVYLLNYRGYGASEGTPTEEGLYTDALAIYDRLKAHHRRISVIGRSLGGSIATSLAASRRVEKLILITPFDSAARLAQKFYPYLPMALLLKDKHDSLSRAAAIDSSVLMLVAGDDRIVTREHSERLAAGFRPQQLEVVVIPAATHNDISSHPLFYASMARFMQIQERVKGE